MDLNAAIRKLTALKDATKSCKCKIELIGLDDNSIVLKMPIDDDAKKSRHHKKVVGFCQRKVNKLYQL